MNCASSFCVGHASSQVNHKIGARKLPCQHSHNYYGACRKTCSRRKQWYNANPYLYSYSGLCHSQCVQTQVICDSDTRKFDRGLTSLLHDELHWLDVPERVTYKMGVMVYRCLHGQAPRYLADHLITSSDVASRLRLRSANRHQLIVPCYRLNTIRPSGVFDCWSDGLELVACVSLISTEPIRVPAMGRTQKLAKSCIINSLTVFS